MRAIIFHQTVTGHDAIGNDIETMYQIISERLECYVYAQNQFNSRVMYVSDDRIEEMVKDKDTVIFYHHSVYWEKGEELLSMAKGRIVIRYHNITPESFFAEYNKFHYSQCSLGRKQTVRLAKKFTEAIWLVDSKYNAEDIKDYVSADRIAVCPPFHKIAEWGRRKPDESLLKELLHSHVTNLLFVGRVAPNKGHLFLIDILYNYCRNYNDSIKLRIIGKFDDGIEAYNNLLFDKIQKYGLENNIEFIGEINDSILISYYLGSDIFLCASEHEGFCVPLVESNYFELPIIARGGSAVKETIGSGQVVLNEYIKEYSAAIHVIMHDEKARRLLVETGKSNYNDRFSYSKIREIFCRFLNRILYADMEHRRWEEKRSVNENSDCHGTSAIY